MLVPNINFFSSFPFQASNFYDIIKITDRRNLEKFCSGLFNPKPFSTAATSHGITNEPIARQAFERRYKKTVTKCGLFINPAHPFLGASPDGLVKGESALLEIKCPYDGRNNRIMKGKKGMSFIILAL